MRSWFRRLKKKFAYAFDGMKWLFADLSVQLQLLIGFGVVLFGIAYSFNFTEWCIVAIAILLVVMLEGLNTVIEELADLVCQRQDVRVKHIKDGAAFAVLLAGCIAVVLFLMILKGVFR